MSLSENYPLLSDSDSDLIDLAIENISGDEWTRIAKELTADNKSSLIIDDEQGDLSVGDMGIIFIAIDMVLGSVASIVGMEPVGISKFEIKLVSKNVD